MTTPPAKAAHWRRRTQGGQDDDDAAPRELALVPAAGSRNAAPQIRVARAFSQIEEPSTLHQLQELLVPTSKKTLDVRRLVSPARPRRQPEGAGLRTPPPVPPTSPASLARATPASSPTPRLHALQHTATHSDDGSDDHSSSTSDELKNAQPAWLRPDLPPRHASVDGGHVSAERRQDASEWAETAARLSRRVQELEMENYRLKNGGQARAAPWDDSETGSSSVSTRERKKSPPQSRMLKSQSCADGFGASRGLTVAQAAAASHRTRSRRLASASSATEAAVKLRSGYWNGANNVKSSLSCNNLADLEQPEFMLEKLRTVPVSVNASVANGSSARGGPAAVPAPPLSAASRKSDSFQRRSSETEGDLGAMAKALQTPRKGSTRRSSGEKAGQRMQEDAPYRVTSPRSYFEAGMRTGSFSMGPGPKAASTPVGAAKRLSNRDVRLWVGTWNMGAADPFEDGRGIIDEQRSAAMLQNFVPHGYHIYVLGVQEGVSENVYHAVEAYLNRNEQGTRYYRLELKNSKFMVSHKNQPPDAVMDAVHGRGDGAFVGTKFTGIAVFHCAQVQSKLRLIRAGAHKFNLTSGSKGGVAVALLVNHTTMVFVNCHLDARNDTYRREQIRNLNASLGRVMGHHSFDLTEQFHHVVWMGDMNYRIVLLDPQMVLHMLEEGRNLELHDKFDGLLNDRRNGGVFEGFTEPHKFPDFYPTYKKFPRRGVVNESLPLWPSLVFRVLYKEPFYKGGKVKKRVPGWCDRILIHSLLVSDSKLVPEKVQDPFAEQPALIDNYRSVNHGDGMDVSDHSPVYGTFVLSFPQRESEALTASATSTSPPRRMTRRNSRSFSMASGMGEDEDRFAKTVGGSYFDQARVVRHMKAQNRPVSTVLRVFNMQLSWNDNVVVPKKTRVVAPLVGEDLKQCDVIGERCQAASGLNLSLNAVIQHARPLEQLHMLVWVKNESINGHCTLSLKRIARQTEGGEVKFRVPLYNDSMRVHLDGHPLLVVFSVRSKTFAK